MTDDIRVRYGTGELREFLREVRSNGSVESAERVDDGDTVTRTYGASAVVLVRAPGADSGVEPSRYTELLPEEYEWSRHRPYEGPSSDGMFDHAVILPLTLDSDGV